MDAESKIEIGARLFRVTRCKQMCVFDSFLLHHVHFNAARFAVVRFYLNSIYFAAEMCLSVKYFADVDREIDTTKELRRIVQLLVMFQVEDYIHAFYMKQ